jgi:TDG/mug DNA glycosylase family protein
MGSVLPDVLQPGLVVVFVGTAASRRSAEVGAPYAGPGNKFWDILHTAGFTPQRMEQTQFESLPEYGIGLTGMAPHAVGNDDVLKAEDFDPAGVRAKIEHFKPRVLAFVGKRAAQEFFGRKTLDYGRQAETIGDTVIWVLPSTSGAARRYWDESPWRSLAAAISPENDPQND